MRPTTKPKKFFRECPVCEKQLGYVSKAAVRFAERQQSSCQACAKRHKTRYEERIQLDDTGTVALSRVKAIELHATRRGISFEVTPEYLGQLLIDQGHRCALTGYPIYVRTTKQFTASLDRIDNTKGYVEGNVQWVRKEINLMKLTHGNEEFIDICRRVSEYNY